MDKKLPPEVELTESRPVRAADPVPPPPPPPPPPDEGGSGDDVGG